MTEHDKADEARKGLFDSVKGKAKEFAGAVTGNDSLTAEGQLEQTQARERKEANSVEAVADAEAEQARAAAADARLEGAHERVEQNAKTAAVEGAVQAQQNAQKRIAEQAGHLDAARAASQAEVDAQREVDEAKARERVDVTAASGRIVDAADDHDMAIREADDQQAEADDARQRAAALTNQADLP
jgi:uncharacterized protein YjbJ (UPF0337 family)